MNAQLQPETVEERARQARLARGWSQARLAREANVSENTVLNFETGKHITRPSTRRRILEVLGMAEVERVIDLDGVPDDVVVFLRHAAARLSALPEGPRARVLADLYPQIITAAGNEHEIAARVAELVREAHAREESQNSSETA